MAKHCITFAPFLKELNGHVMDYHLTLKNMFEAKDWQVYTLVGQEAVAEPLPKGWSKCLYNPPKWSHRSFLVKCFPRLMNLKMLFKLFESYEKAINALLKSKDPKDSWVFVFETFNTFHLYILNALLSRYQNYTIDLVLIYRYDSKQLFFKGKKEVKLLSKCEKKLKKGGLHLFADTDLLACELSGFFKKEVHLLPIPHTSEFKDLSPLPKDLSVIWWPGVPRRPKGLSFIQKLIQTPSSSASKWTLKLSEKTPDLNNLSGLNLISLPNILTREEYLEHFKSADIILLPYAYFNYRFSSSGIFVEAIIAGKLPLVSKGLWMANELEKFNLKELVIDFEVDGFFSRLNQLSKDLKIRKKLEEMQAFYKQYHSEKSFAETLFEYV